MTLSQNDQEILNRIFNRTYAHMINYGLYNLFIFVASLFIQTEETEEINPVEGINPEARKLEIEAIKLAESSDPPCTESLLSALNLIEEAIKLCGNAESDPSHQSLLNNKGRY